MSRRRVIGPDRFGPLLFVLLAAFVLLPVLQEKANGALLLAALLALILVAALVASGVGRRVVIVGGGLGVAVAVIVAGSAVVADGAPPAWVTAAFAGLLSVTTVLVMRRILQHETVTLSTLSGALCAYLMVGFAFGMTYRTMSVVDPEAFTEPLLSSSTYFSFVTLTTLGYGDISPVSDVARSFSILEAIIGQVLLVVVVARFVGMLGQPRQHVRSDLAGPAVVEDPARPDPG